jgi:hypothetical protein
LRAFDAELEDDLVAVEGREEEDAPPQPVRASTIAVIAGPSHRLAG